MGDRGQLVLVLLGALAGAVAVWGLARLVERWSMRLAQLRWTWWQLRWLVGDLWQTGWSIAGRVVLLAAGVGAAVWLLVR